jgi:RIO-like serine/threonine protein kinase
MLNQYGLLPDSISPSIVIVRADGSLQLNDFRKVKSVYEILKNKPVYSSKDKIDLTEAKKRNDESRMSKWVQVSEALQVSIRNSQFESTYSLLKVKAERAIKLRPGNDILEAKKDVYAYLDFLDAYYGKEKVTEQLKSNLRLRFFTENNPRSPQTGLTSQIGKNLFHSTLDPSVINSNLELLSRLSAREISGRELLLDSKKIVIKNLVARKKTHSEYAVSLVGQPNSKYIMKVFPESSRLIFDREAFAMEVMNFEGFKFPEHLVTMHKKGGELTLQAKMMEAPNPEDVFAAYKVAYERLSDEMFYNYGLLPDTISPSDVIVHADSSLQLIDFQNVRSVYEIIEHKPVYSSKDKHVLAEAKKRNDDLRRLKQFKVSVPLHISIRNSQLELTHSLLKVQAENAINMRPGKKILEAKKDVYDYLDFLNAYYGNEKVHELTTNNVNWKRFTERNPRYPQSASNAKLSSELFNTIYRNPLENWVYAKEMITVMRSEKMTEEQIGFSLKEITDKALHELRTSGSNLPLGSVLMIDTKLYALEEFLGQGASGMTFKVSQYDFEAKNFKDSLVMKIMYDLSPDRNLRLQDEFEREMFALGATNMLEKGYPDLLVNVQKEVEGRKLDDVMYANRDDFNKMTELKRQYDRLPHEFLTRFGLIHNDVAPRNVIVRSDGSMQLIDMGWVTSAYEEFTGTPIYKLMHPQKTSSQELINLNEQFKQRLFNTEQGKDIFRQISIREAEYATREWNLYVPLVL